HITTHFAGKPHNLEVDERRKIADEVAEVNGLITNEEVLRRSEFPFPAATSKPIEGLAAPKRGMLQCIFESTNGVCGYICGTASRMRAHCIQEHKWASTCKGGRRKKHVKFPNNDIPWRTDVSCQRFFVQGAKSRYFEVQAPSPQIPSQAQMRSRTSQFQTAKQEMEEAFRAAEDRERQEIKEFEESREPNPWLRRVGWAAHLAGLDRDDIREMVEPADDEEPELQILCKAWMDITTVRSYTHVWRQILCYIVRAEEEDPINRPAYKLTPRQEISIQILRESIRKFQAWKHAEDAERDGSNGKEEEDNEGEWEESDEEIKRMKKVQRDVLRFCIDLLDHPLQDREYESAMISGLAVLGLRDDEGWLDAEDYTPKYSAAIKLARLMVVQEAYERKEEAMELLQERYSTQQQGISQDESRRETSSYYHLISRMVKKFMTMSPGDRDPTPMQWIFRARSYGFKIRYTTTAEGCIQWVGDTILYQQIRFDMAEVKTMMRGLVDEARAVLYKELMMVDVDSQGQVDATQVPGIDWDMMVDNPSENRVGWSFLDDERNRFEVDGKWWLYERMFTEQRVRERFINETSEDERPTIRKDIADQYQRSIDRFREVLLLLFHLSGAKEAPADEPRKCWGCDGRIPAKEAPGTYSLRMD
ncbi:hypothetical protein V501_01471, partial [Pseudogymnoascus sp. VKM F-4519 (FW-2642)]